MATNFTNQESLDLKSRSLYARLKRLFSTDVIVRNVGGKLLKIKDTDQAQYATDRNTLRDRFNRVRTSGYSQYSRDFTLAYQASRIELFRDYDTMDMDPIIACLASDTYISTLNGNVTIKELAEKYPNGESFEVWSWDKENCKYTIGNAHHPRKTGTKKVVEIHFDNNTCLKCTEDHRILLIDGTYKQARDLKTNDSVMPFLYKNDEYMMIKSKEGKYKKAHRYIYEDVFDKNIDNIAIHHINHNKYDNRSTNLQEMSITEHALYHGKSPITIERKKIIWSEEAKKKQGEIVKERFDNPKYREKFSSIMKDVMMDVNIKKRISDTMKSVWKTTGGYKENALSGWKKWQASKEGKDFMSKHSSKMNSERWKNDINYKEKMTKIFSDHAKKLWNTDGFKEKFVKERLENLKLKIANDPEYTKKTYGKIGTRNPNFNNEITNEFILVEGQKYNTLKEFADSVVIDASKSPRCKSQFIRRRLGACGYNSFDEYKQKYNYTNHKVIKIVNNNETSDVYDLTVDFFENFCLKDGIIVSNSALDIYSDECLKENEFGQILTVKSTNDNIKKILHNLFYDILNIEFNLWSWTRNMCKYGDFYLKLYISPEYGIFLVEPLSSYNVTRVENSNPENKNYIKYQISFESGVMEELENYQIAHFRLISDSNFLPYGKSMVEGARRVWKQLSLMEDAMLIHRIMRAPEKRVFKVDVGNIPPNEVDQYMDRLINKMKKIPYIDEKTGDYNLRFNLQNMVEDFYIPVRGGDSGTAIEPLSGMEFTGIDDIEYLRNKMMAALKIPKAFLSYEEDLSGKATLAAEDVRFAGTISRIQKILISELSKIAIVHLYSQGYTDAELVDFSLEFANPSIILEKEKVAILTDKVSVAKDIRENKLFSTEWIYKNLFKFSDDDILKIKNALVNDAKQEWRLKSISEEGTDPAVEFEKMNTSGAGGGGPPSEGGAGEGFPGEPGGPPEPGGAPGGEAPPGAQKVGGGPETPEAGAGKELPPLTEKAIRPSQEGEKNAKDYPFGEDPLGSLENNADYRKNPLQYKYKKNSPLGFESVNVDPRKLLPHVNLKSLAMFLKNDEKRELLQENKDNGSKSKSMLDETNIRGE
jgi:hypothetical protein